MDVTQLKAGRYQKMHHAKRLYNSIKTGIEQGMRVQVSSYTQSRIYTRLEQFKVTKYNVFVARGKNWDCIDYCSVRVVL